MGSRPIQSNMIFFQKAFLDSRLYPKKLLLIVYLDYMQSIMFNDCLNDYAINYEYLLRSNLMT